MRNKVFGCNTGFDITKHDVAKNTNDVYVKYAQLYKGFYLILLFKIKSGYLKLLTGKRNQICLYIF